MNKTAKSIVLAAALTVAATSHASANYGQGQYGQGTVLGKGEEVEITYDLKETGLAENLTAVSLGLLAGAFYFYYKARKEPSFR